MQMPGRSLIAYPRNHVTLLAIMPIFPRHDVPCLYCLYKLSRVRESILLLNREKRYPAHVSAPSVDMPFHALVCSRR